jgi:glycosyltransferase involved in cell wall biosynthesis
MSAIGVMQVTDSLLPGGLERMAVNIANSLPRERFAVHLCTTRAGGPLDEQVARDVRRLNLGRKSMVDPAAFRRFRILHAHGTSLFIAVAASCFRPFPIVVWHVHLGRFAIEDQPALIYRLAVKRVKGVITVNQPLVEWCVRRLRLPRERVRFVQNFVAEPCAGPLPPELPGSPGSRIVCVANLRPDKDHETLLRAMTLVVREFSAAHLILLGSFEDSSYRDSVINQIGREGLSGHVSWLGSRPDVHLLLKMCDIGVLSSKSEGLPLALIEYGMAGLSSVATRVGQCPEVVEDGRSGLLVPPGSPGELAGAILSLLESPARRKELGTRFSERVRRLYGSGRSIEGICGVYDSLLGEERRTLAS